MTLEEQAAAAKAERSRLWEEYDRLHGERDRICGRPPSAEAEAARKAHSAAYAEWARLEYEAATVALQHAKDRFEAAEKLKVGK